MLTTRIHRAGLALASATMMAAGQPGLAEPVRVASAVPVAEAVSRLTGAVEAAGARVFQTIDFQAGNARVGIEIPPTTLVIFGDPRIGAQALVEGQTLALSLPLKILAYQDGGGDVWLIYDDPALAAEVHGVDPAHPAITAMRGALQKMAAVAAGG